MQILHATNATNVKKGELPIIVLINILAAACFWLPNSFLPGKLCRLPTLHLSCSCCCCLCCYCWCCQGLAPHPLQRCLIALHCQLSLGLAMLHLLSLQRLLCSCQLQLQLRQSLFTSQHRTPGSHFRRDLPCHETASKHPRKFAILPVSSTRIAAFSRYCCLCKNSEYASSPSSCSAAFKFVLVAASLSLVLCSSCSRLPHRCQSSVLLADSTSSLHCECHRGPQQPCLRTAAAGGSAHASLAVHVQT